MKDNEAKTHSTTDKEWYLDVTVEQYEEMKAKGIDDETLFKPGRHVFRRRDPNKIVRKNQTTVVLNLDEETFAYFQRRAAEQKTENVEEQIKSELRAIAEREAA
jgi:hypothetical protein